MRVEKGYILQDFEVSPTKYPKYINASLVIK